ncbi:MAG: hypothetical protein AABY22_24130 [Nanoarchaeota archaeon]
MIETINIKDYECKLKSKINCIFAALKKSEKTKRKDVVIVLECKNSEIKNNFKLKLYNITTNEKYIWITEPQTNYSYVNSNFFDFFKEIV